MGVDPYYIINSFNRLFGLIKILYLPSFKKPNKLVSELKWLFVGLNGANCLKLLNGLNSLNPLNGSN